VSLKIYSSWN